jgi:hypothetical protein
VVEELAEVGEAGPGYSRLPGGDGAAVDLEGV